MNQAHTLTIPLGPDDIRELKLGDIVYIRGQFYTCRSQFLRRAAEQGILPPVDFRALNCMVHVGPVLRMEHNNWQVVSFDPTSSIRFEKFCPVLIEKLHIRAIVGKTTMGDETLEAMREFGCVHLSKIGIYGNMLARQIGRVVAVHNLDELGKTEATWIMETDRLGPFFVDMDARGHNLFTETGRLVRANILEQYRRFGIDPAFQYTMKGI